MSCCNISPETVAVENLKDGDYEDKVTWDSQYVRVVLEDRAALFRYKGTSLLKESLKEIVRLRGARKRSDPLYATSLNVCANSAYGCVGYQESAMYSPSCSASVTAIGRWCVKLACRVLERHGLSILYDDTDSCFVSPSSAGDKSEEGARRCVAEALSSLLKEFEDTPLQGMTMEMETYHPRVILLDKKRYCKMNEDGTKKYTGVFAARRKHCGTGP
ncbi:DNA polymerase pol2 [Colletotrichum chrysophilum]|uniref:DNA-directed DNA polymerase n=1 Tax=Colletotrichum chrysophilum TaxID=1836956 RepID=A0AAD9E5V0_9PEZI|nr:DNA polymerase pol2 [Colletotrichum chrysophilum]